MIEEIEFWLVSIVEDNPIPYEIKHIVFCYEHKNNCFVLSMGGCELKPTLNNMFDYYPLEAQYFFSKEINTISNESYFINIIKDVINESFSSEYIKSQFAKKNIYLADYGKSVEFLFSI